MKKAMVIGCPGSGKSTFSRALAEATGLAAYHLDMLFWNADKTTVDSAEFHRRLTEVLEKPEWILDGDYASTMELRMRSCDTVLFLDYPVELCLEGIRARQGKPRGDMPWVEEKADEEFLAFIKDYESSRRPKVLALLEQYREKEIHIFRTREEAARFLNGISK